MKAADLPSLQQPSPFPPYGPAYIFSPFWTVLVCAAALKVESKAMPLNTWLEPWARSIHVSQEVVLPLNVTCLLAVNLVGSKQMYLFSSEVHVAAVRVPRLHELVPETVYPESHVGWHVEPLARELVQSPA